MPSLLTKLRTRLFRSNSSSEAADSQTPHECVVRRQVPSPLALEDSTKSTVQSQTTGFFETLGEDATNGPKQADSSEAPQAKSGRRAQRRLSTSKELPKGIKNAFNSPAQDHNSSQERSESRNGVFLEAWDRVSGTPDGRELGTLGALQAHPVEAIFNELRRMEIETRNDSRVYRALLKMDPIIKKVATILTFATPAAGLNPISSTTVGMMQTTVKLIIDVVKRISDFPDELNTMLNYIPSVEALAQAEGHASSSVRETLVLVYVDLIQFHIVVTKMLGRGNSLLVEAFHDRLTPIVNNFNKHMEMLKGGAMLGNYLALLEQQQSQGEREFFEEERRCWEIFKSSLRDELETRRKLRETRAIGSENVLFQDASSPFVIWQKHNDPKIIAVQGLPGTGKTMAMGSILDVLDRLSLDQGFSDLPIVCSFFCRDERDRSKYVTILRSLVAQMIYQKENLLIWLINRLKLHRGRERLILETESGLESLVLTMISDTDFRFFIVIDAIDECDEGSRESLSRCLENLYQRLHKPSRVKVLLSARPGAFDDFCKRHLITFEDFQRQSMPLIVKHHVDRYLIRREQHGGQLREVLCNELLERAGICTLWVETFLEYLRFTKTESIDIDQLRRLLNKTPSDLPGLYAKMMRRLDYNETYVVLALGILSCAYRPLTIEELSSAMTFATSDSSMSSVVDLSKASDPKRVVALLAPFTTCQGDELAIFHKSVKDFVLNYDLPETLSNDKLRIVTKNDGWQRKYFHGRIARLSISYLSMSEFEDNDYYGPRGSSDQMTEFYVLGDNLFGVEVPSGPSLTREDMNTSLSQNIDSKGPLYSYASCYWAQHLALANEEQAVELVEDAVAMSKPSPDSNMLWNWSQTYRIARPYQEFPSYTSLDALVIAAMFDHHYTIRHVLTGWAGEDGSRPQEDFEAACVWAARQGSLRAIKELFKANLSEVLGLATGKLLYEALSYGQDDVAAYILKTVPKGEIGFSMRSDNDHPTPLTLAIRNGRLDLVKSIYPRTVLENRDWRVLYIAIPGRSENYVIRRRNDRQRIFKYVMKNTIIAEDTFAWLLYKAAACGCLFSCEYLLNPKDGGSQTKRLLVLEEYVEDGRTALHAAVQWGHVNVLEYLLQQPEMRSRINQTDNFGEAIIHLAAKLGRVEVINTIIRYCPTSAMTLDEDGWTPTLIAAFHGHTGVLETLVAAVMDAVANCPSSTNGRKSLVLALDMPFKVGNHTPLMCAARRGNLAMCEVLILTGLVDWSKVLELPGVTFSEPKSNLSSAPASSDIDKLDNHNLNDTCEKKTEEEASSVATTSLLPSSSSSFSRPRLLVGPNTIQVNETFTAQLCGFVEIAEARKRTDRGIAGSR